MEFPPNFLLVSNLTQDPPCIIFSNSEQISSSEYPESYTIRQKSIHSSYCIAPSPLVSTWSNKTVELILAKFDDQNFKVSSKSIVFESSMSISLNNLSTFSNNFGGNCYKINLYFMKITYLWYTSFVSHFYLFFNIITIYI